MHTHAGFVAKPLSNPTRIVVPAQQGGWDRWRLTGAKARFMVFRTP
ncbi:MAG: hypothetical protein SNJ74_00825 [Fimbriimonadaceae bacterium]